MKLYDRCLSLGAIAGLSLQTASGQVQVLTHHNDNARTGLNTNETLLTPGNVNLNSFGRLFEYAVDGYVYAQPLYVSGVVFPGRGVRNAVFVATQHNSVYAFDADSNQGPGGGLLWRTNLGPSAPTPTAQFGNRYGSFNAIVPEVGITGTPVIDLAAGNLYVDTFMREGGNFFHRLHALNITNGQERSFSPVLVQASCAGSGVGSTNGVLRFQAKQHIQRCALTLAGGRLYVAYAGYADTNPFHGWVLGYNPLQLQLLTNYVFNTTPNAKLSEFGDDAGEGGIWMSGAGLAVDAMGDLYFASGNGSFSAFTNGVDYGDSVMRLSTSSGLTVADYFTPFNQAVLTANDLDVGSGGIIVLPNQPGPRPRMMLSGGKQGRLYLLNRDQLTTNNIHHNNGGTYDPIVQTLALGGGVSATPAYFNGAIYIAAVGDVLASFRIVNGLLALPPASVSARRFPYPGVTPSISANGTNSGIVWALQMGSPGVLRAYPATNLAVELYNSSAAPGGRDVLTNGVKFTLPTIANGKVFAGGQYRLAVLGLLASPWTSWKSAHFGANAGNPLIAGPTADPDADGAGNVFEYSFATDPNGANSENGVRGSLSSGRFELQFCRNLTATDLTYAVQRTTNLIGPWTNVATFTTANGWVINDAGFTLSEAGVTGSAPDEHVNVTLAQGGPAATVLRAFFRILITLSP
ncbi:MAG TPA: pyrrolo-quinoline quinone [Clostridia bacterium]|nr:pyrrolo-quinoline quinone [Clostridia bacterium]